MNLKKRKEGRLVWVDEIWVAIVTEETRVGDGTAQPRVAKEEGIAFDSCWPDGLWYTDRGWMVAGLPSGLCCEGLVARLPGSNSNRQMWLKRNDGFSEMD